MSESSSRAGRSLLWTAARILFPVLGLLLAVLYPLAMSRDFEFSIGHFARGSVLFGLVTALSVCGILAAILSSLPFARGHALSSLPAPGPVSVFGAVLGACMAVWIPIRLISTYSLDLANQTAQSLSPVKLALAAGLTGLSLAAALPLSLSDEKRRTAYGVILILAGALSVNISMFAAYFDFSVPLNSPVRNLTTLAQASVLLFLLAEARISLTPKEEPSSLPPSFQIFTSAVCAVFGIGIGGGGAVWQIARSFSFGSEIIGKTPEPNLLLARLALYLAVGCVAADRLWHTDLRKLTAEEIEEAKRRAEEEKKKKKNKSRPDDGKTEPGGDQA